jgi:endoplasmic reticulum-Golgi intermediate compartment protein 3
LQLVFSSFVFYPQQQTAVLPGIFFVYDLSPFMLEVHHTSMPLLHFITKLLAIVGGVFTILGVVDSVIHKIFKSKNQ